MKLGFKAFRSGTSLLFSILKLKKATDMKDEIIKYIEKKTDEIKKYIDLTLTHLKKEKCTQYSLILQNIIKYEMEQLDQSLNINRKLLIDLLKSPELSDDKFRLTLDQQNSRILTILCQKDTEYCPQFIESLNTDKSFINSNPELQNILKEVGLKQLNGPINSVISVFKGINENVRSDDRQLAISQIVQLLASDYSPVFQTPSYDIYACRSCADRDML